MFQVLIIFFFIFIIAFHLIFYHKYHFPKYVKEIEKIPGPKGVFYFGNILRFYQLKSEEMLPHMREEFKTWGPTLRYWYSGVAVVVTSEIEDVQTILLNRFGYEKGLMYEHLKPWLGTGLLISKGEKWKMMRKIITPTFHFSILREYIHVFTKNTKIMMGLLKKHKDKEKCNLSNFITYCALDSICETSMGKEINAQITKSENEYVRAILRIGQIVVERLFSPFLYMDHTFMLSSLGRENSSLLKTLHGVTSKDPSWGQVSFESPLKSLHSSKLGTILLCNANLFVLSDELIQERKQLLSRGTLEYGEDEENGKKKIPFLDLLIEKQKIYHFSDADLREEVDTVLMAGHDTTSTALTWCFFELGLHEDIQDKVYEELNSIFEGSDREPTYADLMRMEYLKRVLQETLRLYPSVPVISRKFDVDIQLKNYLVPANTDIVLVLYHIHRNPDIYPNPEEFDPDRFLPDMIEQRNPFAYIPFSAGQRNCIGQKYAMLQMLVLSSYVLRKYKLKTLTSRESVKPVPDVILRPNVQLEWKMTPRNSE